MDVVTAIAWFFGGAAASLILLGWSVRAAAEQRRRWIERYFRRGGLVGSLMQRWRGTPRLTDQRPAGDEERNGSDGT